MCCLNVCDMNTLTSRRPEPELGFSASGKIVYYITRVLKFHSLRHGNAVLFRSNYTKLLKYSEALRAVWQNILVF